jgi:hypothetical protein
VEQYFRHELKEALDDEEFCAETSERVKILLEA